MITLPLDIMGVSQSKDISEESGSKEKLVHKPMGFRIYNCKRIVCEDVK